jgi:hypothetical protein
MALCVEADTNDSLDTILPIQQYFIPVAFKECCAYVDVTISKVKVNSYFKYFKASNP